MALKHAQPLDVIDLQPPAGSPAAATSASLLKTPQLQLMRLVLAAGQQVPEHHVPGPVTIQCLAGAATVTTPAAVCRLVAGQLVVLPPGEPHAVQAHGAAALLVTIVHPI